MKQCKPNEERLSNRYCDVFYFYYHVGYDDYDNDDSDDDDDVRAV